MRLGQKCQGEKRRKKERKNERDRHTHTHTNTHTHTHIHTHIHIHTHTHTPCGTCCEDAARREEMLVAIATFGADFLPRCCVVVINPNYKGK